MELMDKLVTLCKRRGFVFANSEVYSGLSGFWDYGPLGVEMKKNIERFWWDYMVRQRDNVVGLDSACIGPESVWTASGHVGAFNDALIDDKNSKERFRIDQLQYNSEEDAEAAELYALTWLTTGSNGDETAFWDGLKEQIGYYPMNPSTGKASRFTVPRQFNLMFRQNIGATGEGGQTGYLRAETCQPIFVDFDNVRVTARQKIPFGICQVGKAFRNEINPRNFLFRAREFEQMELEFFVRPDELTETLRAANITDEASVPGQPSGTASTMEWYQFWFEQRRQYYRELGIPDDMLRIHEHPPEKLAHYAKAALDFEFHFPFGWGELEGVHHRGNFDLAQHQKHSGKSFEVFDDEAQVLLTASGMDKAEAKARASYLPVCIETSVGLGRMFLAVLTAAYFEDEQDTRHEGKATDIRIVLRLHPRIAPITAAILPLSKKLSGPDSQSYKLYRELLAAGMSVEFDDAGSIGKRYRRHDEIGTPWCLTFDFETETDGAVTVRDRDSLEQLRIPISEVADELFRRYRQA
jgi:glycyl-tRNA synthetase